MMLTGNAQPVSFNFHHMTTSNGLSSPVVRNAARDKYGYVWLGTDNGLNRYNGYDVKILQHNNNDTFSLPENNVLALFCDADGDLWIGERKGLYKYDYSNSHFIFQQSSTVIAGKILQSAKMLQAGKNQFYIPTSAGIVLFNTKTSSVTPISDLVKGPAEILLARFASDYCLTKDGTMYLATDTGIIKYDPVKQSVQLVDLAPVKNKNAGKIAITNDGSVWISYKDNGITVLKTDLDFSKYTIYDKFKIPEDGFSDNDINAILADNKGRVWFSTFRQGIVLYDPSNKNFTSYKHDPFQSMSLASNFSTFLYQDRDGFIWAGTEGYGGEYYHPDKNFFTSIQQSFNQNPTLPDNWSRAAGEDKDGNLWLGTSSGIAKYDLHSNKYTVFQNTTANKSRLYANSVRSILCDGDIIWIGENGGLNRYHLSTGKMDFLGPKDSIPNSFFWSIIKDHDNNVWFGTRDGLYRYNAQTKRINSLASDSLLASYWRKNVVSLFEDSHNRLWIGFFAGGILMYDPAGKKVDYLTQLSGDNKSLSNTAVTSVTEDQSGMIWMATLSGLVSYNVEKKVFKHYLNNDANISEVTSSLQCDDENRLWVASSRGLYMLDSARKNFKSFNIEDGLPSVDFNNQSALKMRNGNLLYPTLRGFVMFNPKDYQEKNDSIAVYVSSFKIFGKEFKLASGIEQVDDIHLKYDQDFFSFEMTALNYANPHQTWYAYKLEPFDKEWIYTKERLVNYTNVPGGSYTFHYKTSTDKDNWNTPEKTIHIYIGTVFYKTWWFRILTALLLIAALYWVYQSRIAQKEKVMMLEKKAFSLEKGKALVMYESLKQQLNPHFLFNSLTSLSSLISSNPANAKQFLERMSKIYRYILKSRDSETVPLGDEIKLAEIYTQLQQTRFNEGLQLKIDVPEEYLHKKIAPVTLQNLIENAIKHNIIDQGAPLIITISVENNLLVVSNNLQKKSFVESSNRQGLANMQSLYYYLSGKQIIVTEDENYFTLKIPLL